MRASQIFNNPHYVKKHTKDHLHSYVDDHFPGESGLVISLMHMTIDQTTVKTYHELDIINENLWSYNDFPDTEGFGSSDRYWALKDMQGDIDRDRMYLNCERELTNIWGTQPRYEDVVAHMETKTKTEEVNNAR